MRYGILCALASMLLCSAAVAQLALPRVDLPKNLNVPVEVLDLDKLPIRELARVLESARLERINDFVRVNRDAVDFDADRNPSVRGVLVATGLDEAAVAEATGAGFPVLKLERIDGLDLDVIHFGVPAKSSLKEAERRLEKLLPDSEIEADNIYFQSGVSPAGLMPLTALASATVSNASLGLIDGGVANHASLAGRVEQSGFARGAPAANRHGTSVAALMIGKGDVRGAAPGASLLAADVYGSDKAGGSASAIARALGWLVTRDVAVVTISLVGPDNMLLRKAVSAAQRNGIIVVAAVGNDGPAAPPAFPASYPGVLAITGVDSKNRALPEAGRASHTDFAAPGADIMSALDATRTGKVRGTSFAAPLVAARLSQFYPRPAKASIEAAVRKLMAEALDLGKKGRDPVYGHGLVCGKCGR